MCAVTGYIYFQKLLEPGLFDGVRYHYVKTNPYPWSFGLYFDPDSAYAKHVKLQEKNGGSYMAVNTADYMSWFMFTGAGWVVCAVCFICEMPARVEIRLRKGRVGIDEPVRRVSRMFHRTRAQRDRNRRNHQRASEKTH